MKRFVVLFVMLISWVLYPRNPFSFVQKTEPDQQSSVPKQVYVEADIARTDTQWNIADERSNAIVLKHKDDGHVCQITLTTT